MRHCLLLVLPCVISGNLFYFFYLYWDFCNTALWQWGWVIQTPSYHDMDNFIHWISFTINKSDENSIYTKITACISDCSIELIAYTFLISVWFVTPKSIQTKFWVEVPHVLVGLCSVTLRQHCFCYSTRLEAPSSDLSAAKWLPRISFCTSGDVDDVGKYLSTDIYPVSHSTYTHL